MPIADPPMPLGKVLDPCPLPAQPDPPIARPGGAGAPSAPADARALLVAGLVEGLRAGLAGGDALSARLALDALGKLVEHLERATQVEDTKVVPFDAERRRRG